jgi:glycosyltransferase involved in cell wall biosynthesis
MIKSFLPKAMLLSSYRGWVMEATALESAQAISHSPQLRYVPSSRRELLDLRNLRNLIPTVSSDSLILGYETYLRLLRYSRVDEQSCNLYYTHQNNPIESQKLNRFSKILVMNRSLKTKMLTEGVLENKIQITYGAIDKQKFGPSGEIPKLDTQLSDNYVLISSDCKNRKNPEKILALIAFMPDIEFVIHGKSWKLQYSKKISDLPNLKYIEFDFKIQPYLMRSASAFVSLSTLEGGPYPLLEALASGTPVVASRTGFSEDFVDPSNGYIVEHDDNLNKISLCIRGALELKEQARGCDLTKKDLSWGRLGNDLYGRI